MLSILIHIAGLFMSHYAFAILLVVTLMLSRMLASEPSARASYALMRSVMQSAPFVAHVGAGPFANYLSMEIPFAPIDNLRRKLEWDLRVELKTRGEAHITVINPQEAQKLASKLPIDVINEMTKEVIQTSSWTPVCIGKGTAIIDGNEEHALFLVVDSDDLRKLRLSIYEKFLALGGDKNDFSVDDYFPHITIGFTKRDLHPEDGVVKNRNSCIGEIKLSTRRLIIGY